MKGYRGRILKGTNQRGGSEEERSKPEENKRGKGKNKGD